MAVARAVHLLIDRPIEIYQSRLTLSDTQTVTALATVMPSSGDNNNNNNNNNNSNNNNNKDVDDDDDDDCLTTRTGTEGGSATGSGTGSGSGTEAGTAVGKGTSPMVVSFVNDIKFSQGSEVGRVGGEGRVTVDTTIAMKRRVLWDDCMGFLAHVALPGRLRLLLTSQYSFALNTTDNCSNTCRCRHHFVLSLVHLFSFTCLLSHLFVCIFVCLVWPWS